MSVGRIPSLSFLRATIGRMGLVVWALAATVACASLLASHLLTLPTPGVDDPVLARAVAEARVEGSTWTVLHALSSECECSRRILAHLVSTPRPADVVETVLLVGAPGDLPARLGARGFRFENVSAESLATRYAIPAVPLLVIAGPDGVVRYSGGYTERKQGPVIADLALLGRLRADASVDALPLFGCPINTQLSASLDPVGLR
ncbi:MAG: hypothetical protein V4850_20665 [Myxococcota bacterium]